MLKRGTKVEIISKSIGNDNISFKIGYIVAIRNGNKYGCRYYSISSQKLAQSGNHFLECDFINLDDFFNDKDFEI